MAFAQSINRISPLARAILVIGAVTALVTGVTFAALQNTATLTNNTINSISSENDGLLVDSDNNNTFGKTDQGFAFHNINPGGSSGFKTFKVKNETGNNNVDVYIQVTGEEPLPAGVDPDDIDFIFDVPGGDLNDVEATWGEIIQTNGVKLLDDLDNNEIAKIRVRVHLDSDVPDDVNITPFNFTIGTL